MGHNSIQVTLDTYRHLFPAADEKDLLARAELEILGGSVPDWENELFWIFVGVAITAIAGLLGALLNWRIHQHKVLSDKAWHDYEMRRDTYLELDGSINAVCVRH